MVEFFDNIPYVVMMFSTITVWVFVRSSCNTILDHPKYIGFLTKYFGSDADLFNILFNLLAYFVTYFSSALTIYCFVYFFNV